MRGTSFSITRYLSCVYIKGFLLYVYDELIFFFIFIFCFKVQLTDFENAAYVTFIVLLTRVILSFDLNLLIPLSKVSSSGLFSVITY